MSSAEVVIRGVGRYLPERVCAGAELARLTGLEPERLQRLGYHQVHLAAPGEMPSDMASEAGRRALAAAGLAPDDVSVIIYCGAHKDHSRWQASNKVQTQLEAFNSYVFDLDQGAAGPVLALQLAADLLGHADAVDCVLVCAAESWYTSSPRRLLGRSFVLGDGAAAAVLTRGGGPGFRLRGRARASWGEHHLAMCIPGLGAVRPITRQVLERGEHDFQVWRPGWQDAEQRRRLTQEFNRRAAAVLRQACADSSLAPEQLDFLVLPNLPQPHGTGLCARLGVEPERTSLPGRAAEGLLGGPELLGALARAGAPRPRVAALLGLGPGYHFAAQVLAGPES